MLNRDELANMLQMLAPRTLSDLDVSIMLAEADGNESNTITVMELAHAIRKLQDDDLLAGVVAMHHLEVACRTLANGIRDGKVKVQGDTLRVRYVVVCGSGGWVRPCCVRRRLPNVRLAHTRCTPAVERGWQALPSSGQGLHPRRPGDPVHRPAVEPPP